MKDYQVLIILFLFSDYLKLYFQAKKNQPDFNIMIDSICSS